jgi:hypothetical protein
MRAKLQLVFDVVLALSALTIATVVVLRYVGGGRPADPPPVALRKGDLLPDLSGVDFKASKRTLILNLRSNCGFCTESMPFYRRLAAERKPGGQLRIVAVSGEDVTTFGEYLRLQGLSVDQVVTDATGPFRDHPTPTVILASQSQRVAGVWVGKLSTDREQDLMRASGICESCNSVAVHGAGGSPNDGREEGRR